MDVSERRAGFFSTTAGKLVIGGVAIVAVLATIAGIGIFFMFGQASDQAGEEAVVTQPQTQAPSAGQGGAEASATPRPMPEPEDLFTFRNVFEPTAEVELAPETTDSSSDGGTVDVSDNTLYLAGVSTVDGEPVAELVWNGQTYMLKEGESIPNSPWQVLSIEGDTVVMLYGDSRITLTVGQGISK